MKLGHTAFKPRLLYLFPLVLGAVMLIPLFFLVFRALEGDPKVLQDLLFRPRTLTLLGNTLALGAGVVFLSFLIALPLAFLTQKTDLFGARWVTLLSVAPLAVPGYVMAYALLGLGGETGVLQALFGLSVSRMNGYSGALLALTLYSFPYMFLNLRAALAAVDPSLEESARSLGYSPWQVFFKVVMPQLLPAALAGTVVILLYVIGDFGAVALMRYEAFSSVIYTESTVNVTSASLLALVFMALPFTILFFEAKLLKGLRLGRVGTGVARRGIRFPLGAMVIPSWLFIALVVGASLLLPWGMLIYWMVIVPPWDQILGVLGSFAHSMMAAIPAALIATCTALPIAYLHSRYPGPLSRLVERGAYIGYAVPPLSLALALVFFSLRGPAFLYQSLWIWVLGYGMNFLALAMGPLRSGFHHAPKRLEEAGRSMGYSPFQAFWKGVFPLLRKGLAASFVLVFVMAMKELPLAMLLRPNWARPLSTVVFDRTNEALYAQAAPYAAAIVLFSTLFVGFMLRYEGKAQGTLDPDDLGEGWEDGHSHETKGGNHASA